MAAGAQPEPQQMPQHLRQCSPTMEDPEEAGSLCQRPRPGLRNRNAVQHGSFGDLLRRRSSDACNNATSKEQERCLQQQQQQQQQQQRHWLHARSASEIPAEMWTKGVDRKVARELSRRGFDVCAQGSPGPYSICCAVRNSQSKGGRWGRRASRLGSTSLRMSVWARGKGGDDNDADPAMSCGRRKLVVVTISEVSKAKVEVALKEIRILKTCGPHPFLLSRDSLFVMDQKVCALSELVHGGTLRQLVSREGSLTVDATRFYATEIVDALSCLHARSMAHNALSLDDLQITGNGHLMLINFEATTEESQPAFLDTTRRGGIACATRTIKESNAILDDWWRVGVAVHEMLFGQEPCRELSDSAEFEMRPMHALPMPENAAPCEDSAAWSFVCNLLIPKRAWRLGSRRRGGLRGIREHDFFLSLSWNDVHAMRLTPPWVPSPTNETTAC